MTRSDSRCHVLVRSVRSNGLISGLTLPGAAIEAVNLSRIAGSRLALNDAVAIATADLKGEFAGRIGGFAGDLVRLRAHRRGEASGPWLVVRLPADGASRRPDVALCRIGFRKLGNQHYGLVNIGRPRPISLPGAVLWFRNLRTSESRSITLNAEGSFGRHGKIAARPGDRIAVRIAHAGNHRLGTLTVPSATEQMMKSKHLARLVSGHRDTLFDVRSISGRALTGRPRACEVIQGEVTNCHLAGAVSAAAHICGGRIAERIRRIDGEHYSVSLFKYEKAGKRWVPASVVVSNKFYVRASGALLFGSGILHGRAAAQRTGALWWPILEKAYAQCHGGYGHFGSGGTAHHALSMLLGQPPRHWEIGPRLADKLWIEARERLRAGLPVVMSTAGKSSTQRYRNTLIMPDHCYAVLHCFVAEGRRMLALRNPWGEVIPPQSPASRNGSFSMPWETVVRLFAIMSTVDPA